MNKPLKGEKMSKKALLFEIYKMLALTVIAAVLVLGYFNIKPGNALQEIKTAVQEKQVDAGKQPASEISESANRDAVTADLTSIANYAQLYYKRENTFTGWKIPNQMTKNSNGAYTIESISSGLVTIAGEGVARINGGDLRVKVVMTVNPREIVSAEIIR